MNIIVVTSALFCLGLFGVLTRREIIAVLASVELMLGAATVQLVALSSSSGALLTSGHAFALVLLVLAAAEAAVGLALLVILVRRGGRGRIDELGEVDG